MKVIGINGSYNSNGNCAFLLNTILGDLEQKGCQTEIFSAYEAIVDCKQPFCISCSSPCNKSCYGPKLTKLFEEMKAADAVVFASPVYFGTMSGELKCLFDKTRDIRANNALLGKLGIAVACGASKYGGQEKTVDAIHDCMLVDGMTIVGPSSSGCAGHMGVCAQMNASEDEFAISRAHSAADRLYEELTK
ncbi:MAG: flavodoxin family protein [Ruminococcaceae bacterium]|nr:flavodoxin family protein [Oscillospiraceae bacterium]